LIFVALFFIAQSSTDITANSLTMAKTAFFVLQKAVEPCF